MAKSHHQRDAVSRTQSILSSLQSDLDSNGELRAELTGDIADIEAGSNGHLAELLEIALAIEDDINGLFCDLETFESALDVYTIAGSACQRGEFHLSDIMSVFHKLFPNWREFDSFLDQKFKRLHAMKRGIAHH